MFAAYARYGLRVIADPTRPHNTHGYVYSDGEVSLSDDVSGNDPALALHDLAHWRVSSVERRNLPNWGLGEYPNYPDRATCTVDEEVAETEEGLASTLGAYMAGELHGRWSMQHVMSVLGAGGEEDLQALVERGLLVKRPRSYRVVW